MNSGTLSSTTATRTIVDSVSKSFDVAARFVAVVYSLTPRCGGRDAVVWAHGRSRTTPRFDATSLGFRMRISNGFAVHFMRSPATHFHPRTATSRTTQWRISVSALDGTGFSTM